MRRGRETFAKAVALRRLAKLVLQGVLDRRPQGGGSSRHEYHLTDKGWDAAKILLAMMSFGEAWMFERGREPIRLYDRRTGRRVRPVLVDEETGAAIDPRGLYAGPGPAFPASKAVRRARFAEHYERQGRGP